VAVRSWAARQSLPHRRVLFVAAAAQLLSALRAGRLGGASLARTGPVASLRWPFLPR